MQFLWEQGHGAGLAGLAPSQETSHQHLHWGSRQASSTKKMLRPQEVFVWLNFMARQTRALLELGTCMAGGAGRKLGAGGQAEREPAETHLKAKEAEQLSQKGSPKSNTP